MPGHTQGELGLSSKAHVTNTPMLIRGFLAFPVCASRGLSDVPTTARVDGNLLVVLDVRRKY